MVYARGKKHVNIKCPEFFPGKSGSFLSMMSYCQLHVPYSILFFIRESSPKSLRFPESHAHAYWPSSYAVLVVLILVLRVQFVK